MAREVLVLNNGGFPIGVISGRKALHKVLNNKARIDACYEGMFVQVANSPHEPQFSMAIEQYLQKEFDERTQSWKAAMEMPAVIRFFHFTRPNKEIVFYQPFTRKNVYRRDKGRCQYCGKKISFGKFTFDHVIPKSRGGLTSWRNIVCCCLECNSKKDNRTPEEAGMKLIKKPVAPVIAENYERGMLCKLKKMKKALSKKEWRDYIYWAVELDSDE